MKTYDEADEIMILFEEIRLELLQEGKFCYFSFQQYSVVKERDNMFDFF